MVTTLEGLVREYIIEEFGESEHMLPYYMQIAYSGLRELNTDTSGIPKFEKITLASNDTAALPPDYITYRGIYICDKQGELRNLGLNERMCPLEPNDCGDLVAPTGVEVNTLVFAGTGYHNGHFRNGEFIGRYYGLGGGNNANGEYKIFEREGFIALKDCVADHIILEYLADVSQIDGNYIVHPFIIESLKAFIYWRASRAKRTSIGAARDARSEYYNQKRLSNIRMTSFNLDEIKQAIRKHYKLSPKF